jgi:hypothetical protein
MKDGRKRHFVRISALWAALALAACGGGTGARGKRVFVTRTAYQGDLKTAGQAPDGLTGGDDLCNRAAQATLKGGTWKAWLSSESVSALSRLQDVCPWYQEQADGGMVKTFNNKANLSTSPLVGLKVDEYGQYVEDGKAVWTGTATGGAWSGQGCRGFNSSYRHEKATIGRTGAVDQGWTSWESWGCDYVAHLYCFEQ